MWGNNKRFLYLDGPKILDPALPVSIFMSVRGKIVYNDQPEPVWEHNRYPSKGKMHFAVRRGVAEHSTPTLSLVLIEVGGASTRLYLCYVYICVVCVCVVNVKKSIHTY